jgi:hypothetical protein
MYLLSQKCVLSGVIEIYGFLVGVIAQASETCWQILRCTVQFLA